MKPGKIPALLYISTKTSHPEPLKVVYYWEKTKQGQIPDLNFPKNYVCEKDQHAKSCRKL